MNINHQLDSITPASGTLTLNNTVVVNADPTLDLQVATKQYVDAAGASATSSFGQWNFSTSTTPGPSGGQLRANTDDPRSATALYISETTSGGIDATNILLEMVKAGNRLYMQDKDDATKWQTMQVLSDAVDQGSYIEVAVSTGNAGSEITSGRVVLTVLADTTAYVRKAGDVMAAAANLQFSSGGEVLGLPSTPSGATAAASKAYVDTKGTGSVTSVALTMPSIFSVAGSPVTTSGTLAVTLANAPANTFFGGQNGLAGQPSFRAIAYQDIQGAIRLYRENASSPTGPVVTGTNAIAIGSGATASTQESISMGNGAFARQPYAKVIANGVFAGNGDAQSSTYMMRNTTTTAVVSELYVDGIGQRLAVPNNCAHTFTVTITARRTDATGGAAGFKFDGVLSRDATSSTIAFIGTPVKSILGKTDAAWDAQVAVDTSSGALLVRVTGEAAKTIRWVAKVELVEVTQ